MSLRCLLPYGLWLSTCGLFKNPFEVRCVVLSSSAFPFLAGGLVTTSSSLLLSSLELSDTKVYEP